MHRCVPAAACRRGARRPCHSGGGRRRSQRRPPGSISRSAVKPIVSREMAASALFSITSCRSIMVLVIGLCDRFGWVSNSTPPRNLDDGSATPPRGTRPMPPAFRPPRGRRQEPTCPPQPQHPRWTSPRRPPSSARDCRFLQILTQRRFGLSLVMRPSSMEISTVYFRWNWLRYNNGCLWSILHLPVHEVTRGMA